MPEQERDHESSDSTLIGYYVEWRLKPGSEAIADINATHDVKNKWTRAPYKAKEFILQGESATLIRPLIKGYIAERLARYDIVTKEVGIAIIACMKTGIIRPEMQKHVEWRLQCVELKESYSVKDVEGDVARKLDTQALLDDVMGDFDTGY